MVKNGEIDINSLPIGCKHFKVMCKCGIVMKLALTEWGDQAFHDRLDCMFQSFRIEALGCFMLSSISGFVWRY